MSTETWLGGLKPQNMKVDSDHHQISMESVTPMYDIYIYTQKVCYIIAKYVYIYIIYIYYIILYKYIYYVYISIKFYKLCIYSG